MGYLWRVGSQLNRRYVGMLGLSRGGNRGIVIVGKGEVRGVAGEDRGGVATVVGEDAIQVGNS